ncbi:MAG: S-methyl-5'-thioinosine phosphorylase [Gammaproteobacteria bacterium]
MADVAIIGGTGLTSISNLELTGKEVVSTPYGSPSAALRRGVLFGHEVVFLPRHGSAHTIPPHRVNFRANLWALKQNGVKRVIAIAAVGGIRADMSPGRLVFPNQVIDYTWGRPSTFFETDLSAVTHIDFTYPYTESLRQCLIEGARENGLDAVEDGTYGATQGPRLETAAEINRLERDGCDIVGMTGMPEAALARELEMEYATCAVVANWAAGRAPGTISMEEIDRNLKSGMERVKTLLAAILPRL